MIYRDLNNWSNFSSSERKGAFVFFILIMGITISYTTIEKYYNPPVQLSENQIELVDSLIQLYEIKESRNASKLNLKSFNPNQVTYHELIEMGIPASTSKIWSNYLQSGGYFRKSEDLLKVYSMDNSLYSQIEPYVHFIQSKSKNTIESKKLQAKKIIEKKLFKFDPNTISEDSLKLLNLPNRVIANIRNYRAAGGVFYSVNKVKEMYSITDSVYQVIEPYLLINSSSAPKKIKTVPAKDVIVLKPINLNSADSATLTKIKGIGSFRAKIIIERRLNIGGFHNLNQLYDDLYSIDSQVVEQIMPYLYIDSSYQRIRLNTIDYYELRKHFYFDKNMAKSAINYFKQRDQKSGLEDFISRSPISKEKWDKARPYLELK